MSSYPNGRGGEGSTGASTLFLLLPYEGYRNPETDNSRRWVQEFIDAPGAEMDILRRRFIDAAARANLLDPTYTPTEIANSTTATATAAPTSAVSQDTMLDILCYIAGIPTPVETNLTTAQKQALVAVGWDLLRRKGTRARILLLASILSSSGAVAGWTVPPWGFSVLYPDGEPTPGWGDWVPAAAPATDRPWPLVYTRRHLEQTMFPAWATLGVGYSQFRAGFSGAGEPVLPLGCRLNYLANEHFDDWTAGNPDNWNVSGTATLTEDNAAPKLNLEFTDGAAVIDLTGAAAGVFKELSQTLIEINNQLNYRFEIDYNYTNAAQVNKLTVDIRDPHSATATSYYNPTTQTWGSEYHIPIPVVADSTTRIRYGFNIVPKSASPTLANVHGTIDLTVIVGVTSDGTASTQVEYTLYRVGLYEKYSLAVEEAAGGERTGWWPLIDAPGLATFTNGLSYPQSAIMIEPARGNRSSYKARDQSLAVFPYHPALAGRGYQSTSAWVNVVKGSNNFITDWTPAFLTVTANQASSPQLEEASVSAPLLEKTGVDGYLEQTGLVADPSSKSYTAGVWVRKLTAELGTFTDVTLTLRAVGGVTVQSEVFTLTPPTSGSEQWQLLPMRAVTFVAGDAGFPLAFRIAFAAGLNGRKMTVASSYCYDVTSKTSVLYPPVIQTPVGASDTIEATQLNPQITGACLHPFLRRQQVSLVGGLVNLVVVPTFGIDQPNGTIFDFGQTLTRNRLQLSIVSGTLRLRLIDDASANHDASITLVSSLTPAAGQMTWTRDTAITIRARWDTATGLDLTAGNGAKVNVSGLNWTVSDASLAAIGIGNNFTGGAGQFDGLIRDVEVIQTGAI